jgi:hypothetical protein
LNLDTKETRYSEHANEQLYPASTTKILTAYIVLKYGNLDDYVTVSKKATEVPSDSSKANLQMGDVLTVEDLLYGLCQALVRNYLSNLALGKELLPTVSFQGGVATNTGMVKAFEEALNTKIVVPDNHQTMGAIGAALLAMENHQYTDAPTKFKGWNVADMHFSSITCTCTGCSNNCEVITIVEGVDEIQHVEKIKDVKGNIIARWGGTCGRWDIS